MNDNDLKTPSRPLHFSSFISILAGINHLIANKSITLDEWRQAVSEASFGRAKSGAACLADANEFAAACVLGGMDGVLVPLSTTSAAAVVHLKQETSTDDMPPEIEALVERMQGASPGAATSFGECSVTIAVIGNTDGALSTLACHVAKAAADHLDSPAAFEAALAGFSEEIGAESGMLVTTDKETQETQVHNHNVDNSKLN